jgi:N-methylhydantoinase A
VSGGTKRRPVAARLRARKAPGDLTAAAVPIEAAAALRPRRTRLAYFGPELGSLETPVIARDELDATARPGPRLVEEYDTVVVVPPGCTASRHLLGAIIIDVDPVPEASA